MLFILLVNVFNQQNRIVPLLLMVGVELLCITLYFGNTVFSDKSRKLYYGITCLISVAYISLITREPGRILPYAGMFYFLYAVTCMFALFKVIRDIEHVNLEQSPLFIFAATLLLYSSYILLIRFFTDYLIQVPTEFRLTIKIIHNILNTLKNLAIARVLFLQQKATVS